MSFIGSKPSQTLATPTSQYFNGTGSQTVFTLNRAVNVAEDLEVFVNNIQQEPGVGKSYTATGTTLTFDAAPSSGTGNVYVVYRGLAEVTRRLEHDPNAALAATTGTFSGDLTVDTSTLKVDSTNNRVGIVNASPTTALDVTGDITVSGGVVFGATGGTVTGKTLDDYEEGTFTAQMFDANSGGNASSTSATGYYTKIGQLVSVTFSLLNISTSGLTGANVAYFTLPFTASATAGRGSGSVRLDSVTFGGSRTQAVTDVGEGGIRCRFLIFGDGTTDQSITVSDFNGTSSDIAALSLVYITDS
jgi:hypothetical protein